MVGALETRAPHKATYARLTVFAPGALRSVGTLLGHKKAAPKGCGQNGRSGSGGSSGRSGLSRLVGSLKRVEGAVMERLNAASAEL